ncbi:MAG TPA: pseudouridine synthase [Flavobacteriales bacterium]|nr:pseudouridine synthase [Flavobacteriales bacterium]HRP81529.1 pseudouridine synthase [Flavobacteriales bacterium]HRQ83704.1 pseudouridine synthase [Flavobacteriales bacterium]
MSKRNNDPRPKRSRAPQPSKDAGPGGNARRRSGGEAGPPRGGKRQGPAPTKARTNGPKGKPWPKRPSGAGRHDPADAHGGQRPDRRQYQEGDAGARRPFRKGERSNRFSLPNPANAGLVRLNKYLAHAGVGSRRECDQLIASGAVTVNGKVVTELGTQVKPDDVVHFGGQKLRMEHKRYVLLNKPKDTITTTDDPRERHTVMSLIAKAGPERLYPVGRLDRNTTGVLLLTNDGELAKKLTHPSHGAQKLYHATLDRALTVEELHKLVEGVMLDDGPAQADEASFVGDSKREVGLLVHMGRNRVVRRMFSALGAEVVKLDRVMFAGLTKKDLPRGHWRHLEEKEVTWLKQLKGSAGAAERKPGGRRTRLSQGSE